MRTKPRRFQGLENLRSAIDLRETDWRIENGEDPETVEQVVKGTIGGINSQFEDFAPRRPLRTEARTPAPAEKKLPGEPEVSREQEGSEGLKLSADRFLSVSNEPVMTEESEEPETEISQTESARMKLSADRFLGVSNEPVALEESEEHETASEADNEPEAAEIIPNKEGRHSWLYNEVMKAINDAAKGSSAKIIAVFIPVVQNGKEFEDLPADETVTTSPIDISLAKIEAHGNESHAEDESPEIESPSEDFNLIPEIQPEQKAEIAETFREMEEKLDELQEDKEESEALTQDNAPDLSPSEETVTVIEEAEPEISEEESAVVTEDSAQEVFTDETESSTLTEESAEEIFTDESDSAIVIEDSADDIDTLTEDSEPEIMKPEDEAEYEVEDDDDILQDGEPMEYEEISTDESTANESGHEELMLTDELDDDEIFDESLTEVHKADDDKAIIVEEDGIFIAPDDDDEIEIIPDPKR